MKKKSEKMKLLFTWVCIFCMMTSFLGNATAIHAEENVYADKDEATEFLSESRNKAVDWILSGRDESGSFGDTRLVNDTCFAVSFMEAVGLDVPERSTEWIVDKAAAAKGNHDILARVYMATGEQALLTELLKGQNEDGGLGLTKDYRSDTLDSMLLLESFAKDSVRGKLHENETLRLIQYFSRIQKEDGGFGYTMESGSDYGLSMRIALAVTICESYGNGNWTKEWVAQLENYIQENVPSYDENPEENAEYMLYQAMKKRIVMEEGISWLREHQDENGSFSDDIETTIYAAYFIRILEKENQPYLFVGELKNFLSAYVLYDGLETEVTVNGNFNYKTNREQKGQLVITLIKDGMEEKNLEQEVWLLPEEENVSFDGAISITGEKDSSYGIRVCLFVGGKLIKMSEEELRVQVLSVEDILLEAESNGESGVTLRWNDISNDYYRYGYRIYGKTENGDWESHSVWNGEEKVKVLNIYPATWAGMNLKKWMETTVSAEETPAGKGLFEIDTVYIDLYNKNPESYLRNEDGSYKYDVLFFGSCDSNAGKDLNEESYRATQEFIDAGRGVLFGHDTVCTGVKTVHKYFARFEEQLGIKLGTGNQYSIAKEVKVVNEGFLTSYPWKIQGTLVIPPSHTYQQFTGGTLPATVWMQYTTGAIRDDETGGYSNAYLFTNNQLAMIQTGHSSPQATDDERKVLANTLFYLKQLTHETQIVDQSAVDRTAPVIRSINEVTRNGAEISMVVDSEDNGTSYQYYVEGIPEKNDSKELRKKSDIVTTTVTSGICGYEILVNASDTVTDDWTEALLTEYNDGILKIQEEEENSYLHIRAVDAAGNKSEEMVLKIPDNGNQEDCFALEYGLFATEDVTAYVQELTIEQNAYSGGNLTCAGSGITVLGNASCVGQMNLYTGNTMIMERTEQVQAKEMPQLHDSILKSMGGMESLEVLNAYESTQIEHPTWCMTTTGAYCPEIRLNASLMCDNTISIGAADVECGSEQNVALYSVNGDININASRLTGQGLIYAPNGNVTINVQEMQFAGCIIAKRITIQGSVIKIGQEDKKENAE